MLFKLMLNSNHLYTVLAFFITVLFILLTLAKEKRDERTRARTVGTN